MMMGFISLANLVAVLASVVVAPGKDWVPMAPAGMIEAGSALDFSALRGTDAPAGRHGYLVVRNGHFEFENLPGVPQRFYGVNFVDSANVPPEDQAEAFAERLARIGYNAIRIHHHERVLTEGTDDPGCVRLNPSALARLDALAAACIRRGIYLTTDLYVSRRPIAWRAIGEDRDGSVPRNVFKLLVYVHEGAYANYLAFARGFLNHVNPHTGRRWADEPALNLIALVNEGTPCFQGQTKGLRALPDWQRAWRDWLRRKKAEDPVHYAALAETIPESVETEDWQKHPSDAGRAFMLFLADMEECFARRTRAFLRDEIGCRALVSNLSANFFPAVHQRSRARLYDYADDHFYVDHPEFTEKEWALPSRLANVNPLKGARMGVPGVAVRRILGQPLAVTEYNYSAPGRYRGLGGILCGALAALQEWDGLWRFAWSHGVAGVVSPETRPLSYFDMAGDPLSLAGERASLCLFLRHDLEPLKRTYALVFPEEDLLRFEDASSEFPGYGFLWTAWWAKFGTAVASDVAKDVAVAGRYLPLKRGEGQKSRADVFADLGIPPTGTAELPPAGDGQIRVDSEQGRFAVVTARTCGFFAERGRFRAGDFAADIGDVPTTVWVSALDGQPIRNSSRLFLTHLTDVQNSGTTYADETMTTLTDWGRLPHLMRNAEAHVTVVVRDGTWHVYALAADGRRRGEVAARQANGRLSFTAKVDADPASATWLYELERERD